MKDFFIKIWKARGIWLRFLFCWALGLTFQYFDEAKDYDLRFKMRGYQEASKDIVLVNFDQNDLNNWRGANPNALRASKDVMANTDSLFWSPPTWNYLLSIILQQNPRRVGVDFFFSDSLEKPDPSQRALTDPRVTWAAQLDSEGRPALPLLSTAYGYNVALVDLREDEDRILRRFYVPTATIPHMGLKLAESVGETPSAMAGENLLINFRGRADTYPSISALAVLEGRVPPSFFKDKIVMIGAHSFAGSVYQTPLGPMSRNEVLAQIVDDSLNERWINRPSSWLVAGYLLFILLLAVLILTTYPQAVALVFLLWLSAGSISLSLWVFDSFYFWLPAFSPLALIMVTYMIFLGYQLAISENQMWRLEQERNILSELEQLRNNFVSLISHDLKTPIAKIQAICDRLLSGGDAVSTEVKEGLSNVRQESAELHRYIQSILQLSRLESSQVRVRKDATDLNEIVETVVKQLGPVTKDRQQTVVAKLEPLFSIEADTVLIQEVVLNLIENASKYTPNGGAIKVQTEEVDDKVVFSVEDNGPGIPKSDQEHLFEKFFRGQAQKGAIKGTGLGLFLVKYFIELHGGEVFLESELGKGTRVRFTLPLQA